MATLTEIEKVVEQLPLAEQEELLRHLASALRHRKNSGMSASRDDWMQRLNILRASISSGAPTLSAEQIMSELRED